MTTQESLLQLLADGRMHSGEELARSLKLSRAAIWKQVHQLKELQIEVIAQAGQGYRLERPLDFLSKKTISETMDHDVRKMMSSIHLAWVIDSTSHFLAQQPVPKPGQFGVCVAEYQSAGRGRRGRHWLAPFGDGVCLSLSYCFRSSPPSLGNLGLAVGVGLLRALRACGAERAQLKWPNDVVDSGRKLAGILIDVQGEAGGPLHVIVGIGVNYRLSRATRQSVADSGGLKPAALLSDDLAAADEFASVPERSVAAARIIDQVYRVLDEFNKAGFAPFVHDWRSADFLAGKQVTVSTDAEALNGIAAGVAEDGQLRIETEQGARLVASGDVTIRSVT